MRNSLNKSWNFKVEKQPIKKAALTKTETKKVVVAKKETTTKNEDIEEKAFNFIKNFEWFKAKAYWDYKHCSIGYWTTTRNCSEKITEAEAKKRAIQKIKNIRKTFNLYSLDDNLEIALISFSYNVWSPPKNFQWYVKNGYINWLKNLMLKYKYAGWKYLKWLEKRRKAEVELF